MYIHAEAILLIYKGAIALMETVDPDTTLPLETLPVQVLLPPATMKPWSGHSSPTLNCGLRLICESSNPLDGVEVKLRNHGGNLSMSTCGIYAEVVHMRWIHAAQINSEAMSLKSWLRKFELVKAEVRYEKFE